MKKIQYTDLQKEYAGKAVILNKAQTKILAAGMRGKDLMKQLKDKGLEKTHYVIMGPISKPGVVNIYLSIHNKADRQG